MVADVAEIDKKDRGKPSKRSLKGQSVKTLPIPTTDYSRWNEQCMLGVAEWFSTLQNTFLSNSHSDFVATVRNEFKKTFPQLPPTVQFDGEDIPREEHPALGVSVRIILLAETILIHCRP